MSEPDLSHLKRCPCGKAIRAHRALCDKCQADKRRRNAKIRKATQPTKSPEELFAEAIQREKRL